MTLILLLASACADDGVPVGGDTTGTSTGGYDASVGLDGGTADTTGSATTGDVDPSTSSSSSGPDDSTGEIDHGALRMLEVLPPDAVLEVDLETPTVMSFEVLGHYEDGALVDVTSQASLEHDEPMLGVMNGADLEIPPFSDTFVGTTLVTASVDRIVAQARLTVVARATTGAEAGVLFVLPYQDRAGSKAEPLTFATDIDDLDVLLDMDATGGMGGPINDLQGSLVGTVIPGIQASIAGAWFGVAAFMDYPIDPFGTVGCDQPFLLIQPMTPSVAEAQDGVLALTTGMFGGPIGCGNDGPEAHIEALHQIATGAGLVGPAPTFVAPNATGIGGVGFRQGAMPVIVSVTDARSHDPGVALCGGGTDYDADPSVLAVAATRAQTKDELSAICGRVLTMAVSNHDPACGPVADGTDLAEATGALVPPVAWDLVPGGRPVGCGIAQCCTGTSGTGIAPNPSGLCPLVYRVGFGGSGVGDGMTEAVSMLANFASFSVTSLVTEAVTDIEGVPLPPGITTADFIQSVVPLGHGPVPLPGVADPILTADAFEDVVPNTPVTFEVEALNDVVPASDRAQLFRATLSVLADGCADLDQRELLFLVPPEPVP